MVERADGNRPGRSVDGAVLAVEVSCQHRRDRQLGLTLEGDDAGLVVDRVDAEEAGSDEHHDSVQGFATALLLSPSEEGVKMATKGIGADRPGEMGCVSDGLSEEGGTPLGGGVVDRGKGRGEGNHAVASS